MQSVIKQLVDSNGHITKNITLAAKSDGMQSGSDACNCHNCGGNVRRHRFKCKNCFDYVLCKKCFRQDVHSKHNFLEIPSSVPNIGMKIMMSEGMKESQINSNSDVFETSFEPKKGLGKRHQFQDMKCQRCFQGYANNLDCVPVVIEGWPVSIVAMWPARPRLSKLAMRAQRPIWKTANPERRMSKMMIRRGAVGLGKKGRSFGEGGGRRNNRVGKEKRNGKCVCEMEPQPPERQRSAVEASEGRSLDGNEIQDCIADKRAQSTHWEQNECKVRNRKAKSVRVQEKEALAATLDMADAVNEGENEAKDSQDEVCPQKKRGQNGKRNVANKEGPKKCPLRLHWAYHHFQGEDCLFMVLKMRMSQRRIVMPVVRQIEKEFNTLGSEMAYKLFLEHMKKIWSDFMQKIEEQKKKNRKCSTNSVPECQLAPDVDQEASSSSVFRNYGQIQKDSFVLEDESAENTKDKGRKVETAKVKGGKARGNKDKLLSKAEGRVNSHKDRKDEDEDAWELDFEDVEDYGKDRMQ